MDFFIYYYWFNFIIQLSYNLIKSKLIIVKRLGEVNFYDIIKS